MQNFSNKASFCCWAGWVENYLLETLKTSFSQVETLIAILWKKADFA